MRATPRTARSGFPSPSQCCRAHVDPGGTGGGAQRLLGVGGKLWRLRDRVEYPPVHIPELQIPVLQPLQLDHVLVHRAMVTAAEQGEGGQRRGAPVGPVPDVVTLREAGATSRKAAAPIAVL